MLLQQTNLSDATRDTKQELVNTLIKNMKEVWKSIDKSKINNSNFDSIFEQFKKHSVIESIGEFKKSNSPNINTMKYQRDFNSNPNNGNKLMERPVASKLDPTPSSLNQKVQQVEQKRIQQRKSNDPFQGVSADMNNYDSMLDQAFKPIVENINDDQRFNNFDSGRSKDINSKMEDAQKSRQTEISARNQRPPTPDFLKSQKSNPDKDRKSDRNSIQPPSKNKGERPDFVNAQSEEMNQGFQGLANDSGGDLYSLDNLDKPLVEMDMVEDTSNFEDRLKRLQSERGDLKSLPNQGDVIDFTKEDFPKTEMGNNNFTQNKQPYKQQMQQMQQMQQQQPQQFKQPQQLQQFKQPQQQQQEMQEQQFKQQQEMQEQQFKQQQLSRQQSQQQMQLQSQQQLQQQMQQRQAPQKIQEKEVVSTDKFSQLKNLMNSANINIKEDTNKLNQTIQQLEQENIELKELIDNIRNDNSIEKLNEIKQQIADEFEVLRVKNEEYENRFSTYNLKEMELTKKDAEVKQLIKNYDYLFKSSQLQIEVSNEDNKSNYVWPIKNIENVIGIKLMSYSLPLPRFNIEENKNNTLKLKNNLNEEVVLSVKSGKYTIENLIDKMNSMTDKFKLIISNEQTVSIESDEEFEIIPTLLSKYNFGFISECKGKNKYESDKPWDLRIEDKVYLYLNNLSEEIPFGVLYFNGMTTCQFKFEAPFNLDKLEINFKDSKGMNYNFHNLSHSLSFTVDRIN
jgi:hypothetical protein